MLSYRATLDVPKAAARTVSAWLATHRKVPDIRPTSGRRPAGSRWMSTGT
ncbi:hypothetical protein [Actinomyces weissii]|uniref:Uncharacterized protein n=1 Tax=Actinomyces weissii TaxID=675090 RepID=A0A7T7S1W2_9ACTO|nr:hypothetical protein [Actinomyces weissii]QQM67351.1 hypothetical protein JG540_00055 [Actinomyces weissii]